MKTFSIITSFLLAITLSVQSQQKTFHDFTVTTIDGDTISLSKFRGKKILVVNTASKCGLTPQYEDLQELYSEFGGDDFVVIGFPANNFKEQEPGTNKEIKKFCTEDYGVTFPMMAKISVKGDDIHPVYQWLTSEEENGVMSSEVQWNFQKYMINERGQLVDVLSPKTNPGDEKIISWIKG